MISDKEQRRQLNDALRQVAHANRVNWVPTTSRDPVEQRRDRQQLNDAIRRAGGYEPQHDSEGGHHEN